MSRKKNRGPTRGGVPSSLQRQYGARDADAGYQGPRVALGAPREDLGYRPRLEGLGRLMLGVDDLIDKWRPDLAKLGLTPRLLPSPFSVRYLTREDIHYNVNGYEQWSNHHARPPEVKVDSPEEILRLAKASPDYAATSAAGGLRIPVMRAHVNYLPPNHRNPAVLRLGLLLRGPEDEAVPPDMQTVFNESDFFARFRPRETVVPEPPASRSIAVVLFEATGDDLSPNLPRFVRREIAKGAVPQEAEMAPVSLLYSPVSSPPA